MNSPKHTAWSVYMVRCADGTLYTGSAVDVPQRVASHNAARGAKYTKSRLPVALLFTEPATTQSAALKREYRIKQLSRAQKLQLITASRQTSS